MKRNNSIERQQAQNRDSSQPRGKKMNKFIIPEAPREKIEYPIQGFAPYDGAKVYSLENTIRRRVNLIEKYSPKNEHRFEATIKNGLKESRILKSRPIQHEDIFNLDERPTTRELQIIRQKRQALALDKQIEESQKFKLNAISQSSDRYQDINLPLVKESLSPKLNQINTPHKRQQGMQQWLNQEFFYSSPVQKEFSNNSSLISGRKNFSPSFGNSHQKIQSSLKVIPGPLTYEERIARQAEIYHSLQNKNNENKNGDHWSQNSYDLHQEDHFRGRKSRDLSALPSRTEFKQAYIDNLENKREQSETHRRMKTEGDGKYGKQSNVKLFSNKLDSSFENNHSFELRYQEDDEKNRKQKIIQLSEGENMRILEEQKKLLRKQQKIHEKNEYLLRMAAKQYKEEEQWVNNEENERAQIELKRIEQEQQKLKEEEQEIKKELFEEEYSKQQEKIEELKRESLRIEQEQSKLKQLEKQIERKKEKAIAKSKEKEQEKIKQKEREHLRLKNQAEERQKLKERLLQSRENQLSIFDHKKENGINNQEHSRTERRYQSFQKEQKAAQSVDLKAHIQGNSYSHFQEDIFKPRFQKNPSQIFELDSERFQQLKQRPSLIPPIASYSPSPKKNFKFYSLNKSIQNDRINEAIVDLVSKDKQRKEEGEKEKIKTSANQKEIDEKQELKKKDQVIENQPQIKLKSNQTKIIAAQEDNSNKLENPLISNQAKNIQQETNFNQLLNLQNDSNGNNERFKNSDNQQIENTNNADSKRSRGTQQNKSMEENKKSNTKLIQQRLLDISEQNMEAQNKLDKIENTLEKFSQMENNSGDKGSSIKKNKTNDVKISPPITNRESIHSLERIKQNQDNQNIPTDDQTKKSSGWKGVIYSELSPREYSNHQVSPVHSQFQQPSQDNEKSKISDEITQTQILKQNEQKEKQKSQNNEQKELQKSNKDVQNEIKQVTDPLNNNSNQPQPPHKYFQKLNSISSANQLNLQENSLLIQNKQPDSSEQKKEGIINDIIKEQIQQIDKNSQKNTLPSPLPQNPLIESSSQKEEDLKKFQAESKFSSQFLNEKDQIDTQSKLFYPSNISQINQSNNVEIKPIANTSSKIQMQSPFKNSSFVSLLPDHSARAIKLLDELIVEISLKNNKQN